MTVFSASFYFSLPLRLNRLTTATLFIIFLSLLNRSHCQWLRWMGVADIHYSFLGLAANTQAGSKLVPIAGPGHIPHIQVPEAWFKAPDAFSRGKNNRAYGSPLVYFFLGCSR
jgi:hypothetical protein